MKKVLINVGIIVTFLIIYLLQLNFFSWFKIAGVMPNLFVILVLFIGLFMGNTMGITYGIVFGILLDLLIGKKVGITSIGLGIVGVVTIKLDKNFSKDNRITMMLMVMSCTAIYEIIVYILNYMMLGINVEILKFVEILIIEIIYNVLLTIILYPLMQFIGYDIENIFKGNRILTRYF
jgi:rod shape-determining protein MreD